MLVDVLRALLAGRDAFDDTRLALAAILDSFRYGHGGLDRAPVHGPHIDSVLFAATKADHVPDVQRDHLAALLAEHGGVPGARRHEQQCPDGCDGASHRSSRPRRTPRTIEGHQVQVVTGRPVGAGTQSKFFVGNVPIRPPRADHGRRRSSTCRCSSRRPIDPSPVEGIPHINLDSALEFLLGDRLR